MTIAAMLGLGGVGQSPIEADSESDGAIDLYDEPYPTPLYRSVEWEVVEPDGTTTSMAYDLLDGTGRLMSAAEGIEMRFNADLVVFQQHPETQWYAAPAEVMADLAIARSVQLIPLLDDVVPPHVLPYTTVLMDRADVLDGIDLRYLHVVVDVAAFRAADPARYWRWAVLHEPEDPAAGLELWVSDDGVVQQSTVAGATVRLRSRSAQPLGIEVPAPTAQLPTQVQVGPAPETGP